MNPDRPHGRLYEIAHFDRVTNAFSMFVVRLCNAVQICLMAVIRNSFKAPLFIRVSLFVVRPFNNLPIGLMAVTSDTNCFDASKTFQAFPPFQIKSR